jgi:hypothetical protein
MKTKRIDVIAKTLIVVLLVLGFFDIFYSFAGFYAQWGILYPAAHVLLNILLFLSLSFLWTKESWAAWLFLGVLLGHYVLDFTVGALENWKWLLLIPAFLFYWRNRKPD